MGDLMQEKNLNIEKVKEISKLKQEPEWMTEFRVNAYNTFVNTPNPIFITIVLFFLAYYITPIYLTNTTLPAERKPFIWFSANIFAASSLDITGLQNLSIPSALITIGLLPARPTPSVVLLE